MTDLALSLETLLEALPEIRFPLALPGAAEYADAAAALAGQVRDYLLPRAETLDAPLLAVVGGSTGAGKSTLVNSILRRNVTRPGVLRPTTKAPVLICHRDDADWFRSGRILPELTRGDGEVAHTRALQIVESTDLPAGLALLDAPDVDSIDDENRALARQLLLAADLWLFATSAARYADAVPWGFLREASARDLVLGIVVNRCPPASLGEVARDLARLLRQEGLGDAPLFAVPEGPLVDGMIPDPLVGPIRAWLGGIASEAEHRAQVVRQSLGGALRQLDVEIARLELGLAEQGDAAADLRAQAVGEFRHAGDRVAMTVGDGSMLRSEIIAHWHDVVGTGSLFRGLDETVASLRARARRWVSAEPKAERMQEAVSDQLAKVIVDAAEVAVDATAQAWARTTWGRQVLADELRSLSPDFEARAVAAVRGWQQDVLALVTEQGKGKRLRARLLALGTNAIGATLMVVVFASTGGVTGAEAGIAGGTSLLAQRLLESVFGAGAVERLAQESRSLLDARVRTLFDEEASRFTGAVDEASVPGEVGERLTRAASRVAEARAGL